MMYNVYSTDRCPCCGFLTYAEETITCELCSRKFHRTEACLGSGCMSLETITCRMCSLKFQEKPSKRKSDDGEIGNERNLKKWKKMENAKSDVLFTRNGPDQKLEASGKNAKFHVNSNGYDLVENLWSLEKDFNFPVANVFGKVIMDTDIRSLKSNECLTDRVIDCYLLLLATQQNELGRNVVHYDQTKMTGIINSDFRLPDVSQNSGIDVEADVIVGVYHRSYHWTLVIVEVREGKIFFYNPCGERSHEMKKIERSWRKYDSEYRIKYQISNKSPDWKICTSPHALQRDSFNCGIYCLVFAEKHLNGHLHDLQSITKKDLQIMRRKVALELMLYK
ncbi:sentrin-specific protease 2-like, partial [Saccostrea cucullata]|uniref:sentrin-specific protease 2-like n=1 Tax=Saccostrea cuccullata TaxID=36930 RepID=UPI002ED2A167